MIRKLDELDDRSKVWIYQADRELRDEELSKINLLLPKFVDSWISHNNELKAFGKVYYRRFIVLIVDETQTSASGCSIDKSVHFIQYLGGELGVDFFNRMSFAYLHDEVVKTVPMHDLSELLEKAIIRDETLMFDNLVKSKGEFIKSWLKPLKESWHSKFIS